MFPWSDTPTVQADVAPAYAVGERIANSYVPPSTGTIVSVDAENATMGIRWDDGSSAIVYPLDASFLRKAMPWE